jgi:beta-N-acetylhexosaminidase
MMLPAGAFAKDPSRSAKSHTAPLAASAKDEQWAQRTLHQMTVEDKVGQMIMIWAKAKFYNTNSAEMLELIDQMHRYHLGGFGVTVPVEGGQLAMSEPLEAAALTNRLQKESKLPLLFAADFERGLSMRLFGPTAFPAAMAFGAAGDPALAREFGRISGLETRAIGIQWNWFPIADVNSNPDNPIIDTRSFGEDPALVSKMVAAYIEGAHQAGMLTTLKHFPGHGDTATDSHLALARVDGNRARLDAVELVPFRAGIAAGVDSVMVGHLIVPTLEPDTTKPASVSAKVIQGVLQKELGFKGLVVTDAIDMNGLKNLFSGTEAEKSAAEAVAAVKAGNDMVIIPGDVDGAYNGLLRAVKSGEIAESRLDQSVLKILCIKAATGTVQNRFVDLNAVQAAVAQPESLALARQVAERAITLVRDDAKLVPMKTAAKTVAIVFTDHARATDAGRAFSSELRKRVEGAKVYFVDSSNASAQHDEILAAVASADRVIAVAEAMPNPHRTTAGHASGSAALEAQSLALLSSVVAAAPAKTVVAALGNPYTGGSIAGVTSYVCTFSDTILSAASLVGALYGESPIHGRLPVTIPAMAERGTGLDRQATATAPAIK